ncbi:MAG: hypothetical protein ACK45I_03145 [Bacteroidota bacterium]|jgi:cell division protein FtsL
MLKLKLLLIVMCSAWVLKAQPMDTVQLVNYFGRLTPVVHGHAVTYRQLKSLMQRYPETLEAWKKSRNSTRLSQALLLTDVAATLVLLSTKSEKVIMASLAVGVGALITLNLYQETRNLHMLYAVQLYNKKIREELDKSNAPAP